MGVVIVVVVELVVVGVIVLVIIARYEQGTVDGQGEIVVEEER